MLKDVLRREVRERYDHRHLNDLHPFEDHPPTAENFARHVFALLKDNFDPRPVGCLARVEVWEGPEAYAAYQE